MHRVFNLKNFIIFTAPMLIFYTIYMYIPIIVAFSYSFTNFRGIGAPAFIGLKNFQRLMSDRLFVIALANTLKITAVTLLAVIPISFFMAYAINRKCLKNEIFKLIFFAPYTVGGIIVGLVWSFTLDPASGLVNSLLRAAGLDSLALQWIGGPTLTPYVVGFIGVWSSAGFCMLLWMTGFKAISTDVIEASMIDGASQPQQVIYIILPLLKQSFITIFIFMFTGSLKVFDSVYVLTGGGPNHMSETMVSYMYNQTFTSKLVGYGMSISVVEFFIAISVSVLFLFITRARAER